MLDFRGDDAGTDRPQGAAESTERPLRPRKDGQVVAFPSPASQRRRRVEVAAAVPEVLVPADADETVERPAYLASELLKQDWHPRAPLCRTLRWGALGVGVAGAGAILAFGGTASMMLAVAGVLGGCALAALVPLPPRVRSVILAMLGVAGTALVAWLRMPDDPAAPLLLGALTLATSALFYRAAHRTSLMARLLVVLGLATTAAWLVLTGGLDALIVESLSWQDWVEPALRLSLGLVLVASVLTFLDPTGHGGAWVAGSALLVWLALDAGASLVLAQWPLSGAPAATDDAWVTTLAYPFLVAIAAAGLCQVWVLAGSKPEGRREAPTRATLA